MQKIDIAVIDYGMGNLRSVKQALKHVAPTQNVVVTSDANEIQRAARVVFPGQGAMPDCMRKLDVRGLRQAVIEATHTKPFLGVCIGLQMLFDWSEEGDTAGLGLVAGRVKKFTQNRDVAGNKLKIPHMGWNHVRHTKPHALWHDIADNARFYYVHSYYVAPQHADLTVGESQYPQPFTGAIGFDNVFAVQFHPEKSAQAGLQLLSNFVHWNP